jgi:hypothetical protein
VIVQGADSSLTLVKDIREHPTRRAVLVSTAEASSKVPNLAQIRDFSSFQGCLARREHAASGAMDMEVVRVDSESRDRGLAHETDEVVSLGPS